MRELGKIGIFMGDHEWKFLTATAPPEQEVQDDSDD